MQSTSYATYSGIMQQGTATLLLENGFPIVDADANFYQLLHSEKVEGKNEKSSSVILFVHPDDRLAFKSSLIEQLRRGDTVSLIFRNNSPVSQQYLLVLHGHMIDLHAHQRGLWCSLQKMTPPNDESNLINHLKLLVATLKLDDHYSLVYANPAFYQAMDISPCRYDNTFPLSYLDLADYTLFTTILKDVKSMKEVEKEFRFHLPDGSLHWYQCNFTLLQDDKDPQILLSLKDITLLKETQQKLEEEQIQNITLASLSHDVLFEYDLKSDIFTYRSLHHKDYQERISISNFFDRMNTFFHPNDLEMVNQSVSEMLRGATNTSFTARIMEQTLGIFLWRTVHLIYVEKDKIPVKIIGKMIDFHKEKECELHLREELQYDVLTHLYNKVATRDRVERMLILRPNQLHAMLVMDIDNFKTANDQNGHLFGDHILIEISNLFHRLFKNDHIVGRIGGDEFLVLMTDISDEQQVKTKIEELHLGMQKISPKQNCNYSASLSIGYSLFPRDGVTYEEMFLAADNHLYQAKKKKNIQ